MDILDLTGLKALQVTENEHGDYRIRRRPHPRLFHALNAVRQS
jgi:hypothetical protein